MPWGSKGCVSGSDQKPFRSSSTVGRGGSAVAAEQTRPTRRLRKVERVFTTTVVTRDTAVTVNASYKPSRVKQYLKDGRALRIETLVNSPTDLCCLRSLQNLNVLAAEGRDVNARILHTEVVRHSR